MRRQLFFHSRNHGVDWSHRWILSDKPGRFCYECRSTLISLIEITLVKILLLDEFNHIIILMHSIDMLLEVIQPRPYLRLGLARLRSTLIRFLKQTNFVHALLMPLEVIACTKPLTPSLTPWDITIKDFRVFDLVLPVMMDQ